MTDKIHFGVHYADEPLEGYNTFEEVRAAINQLKAAIERGDKEFTFPTVDELNQLAFADFQKAFSDGTLPPHLTNKIRNELKKATDAKRDRVKKSNRKARCRLTTAEVNAILNKIFVHSSDELNQPQQEQQAHTPTAKQINDSLIRAMETNLKNIQAHCRNLDINAAVDELNLYHICNNALLRKEVILCKDDMTTYRRKLGTPPMITCRKIFFMTFWLKLRRFNLRGICR